MGPRWCRFCPLWLCPHQAALRVSVHQQWQCSWSCQHDSSALICGGTPATPAATVCSCRMGATVRLSTLIQESPDSRKQRAAYRILQGVAALQGLQQLQDVCTLRRRRCLPTLRAAHSLHHKSLRSRRAMMLLPLNITYPGQAAGVCSKTLASAGGNCTCLQLLCGCSCDVGIAGLQGSLPECSLTA